ncbi:TetR/AcrR family transcriptional regulator [Actinomadura atramentaria]|uniref:TetR/AcrR family transcriptional regulator n=1 Tax=Actinomadura atramentaria TaxID=1990 RepID=UPI00039B5077|nr:helix-turn-helix domain-containing protein [Actinomadura atramentaria]
MPKDASATRDRLLAAGARLFAARGIDAARTRDIVALAGQGNDSAVTYHFGSRAGLLDAILRAGVQRMEPARRAALPALRDAPLPDVVAAVVHPIADELATPHGRDFLRIVNQVAGRAGLRLHTVPEPIRDTALAEQLGLLQHHLTRDLPEPLALERLSLHIAFLAAALADRAARLAAHPDAPDPSLLDHRTFTADLTAMLTAALTAPPPNQFAQPPATP